MHVDSSLMLKFFCSLQNREAMMLLKKFPNLDKEALQAKYPDIDIEKLKYNKKTLGMHEFNTA